MNTVTVYRQSPVMMRTIGLATLVAVLVGSIEIIVEDYSTGVTYALVAAITALGGGLFVRFTRLATVVDDTGLVVKGFFTTRRVPWSQVQEIIIEFNVSHATQERHPKEIAVAYLDSGRRLQLRGIDDKNLAAVKLSLPAVVESLRRRWMAGRGAGWQPVAAVQAKAAEMARFKASAPVVGVLAFISTVGVMVIVAVLLLVAQEKFGLPVFVEGDSGLTLALLFGLLLGVPVAVGLAFWLWAARQRRRARATPAP